MLHNYSNEKNFYAFKKSEREALRKIVEKLIPQIRNSAAFYQRRNCSSNYLRCNKPHD